MKTYFLSRIKIFLILSGIILPQSMLAAEPTIDDSPPIQTFRHGVKTMKEAIQLIDCTYGGVGVLVAFDFDDTLFSKETELDNGQTLRYLEKSSFTDLALNGNKVHPVFEAVNDHLGLNLLETGQSFRSIRRHFMATSPELPLNVQEDRYYSVEEQRGIDQLRQSIEVLKSRGAFVCIVSAASGAENPLKSALAQEIGIPPSCFLRGAKKFEQVLSFLKEQQDEDNKEYDCPLLTLDSPLHTLILIDDTLSYIEAWEKQATTISLQEISLIESHQKTGNITVVGIHYDFVGQHSGFVEQKMIEEFVALYGKDYMRHPLMQPFLSAQAFSKKKGETVGCFFPFFRK